VEASLTLLNPGPVNTSPAVRRALAGSADQCHREPEYLALQGRVRQKLVAAFDIEDDHEAILLTGSGTAAMEAMIASLVEGSLLVLENGVYGSRLAAIAEAHGIAVERMAASWLERHDPERVARALQRGFDSVAVVHHETTTGLCNDLPALAEAVRGGGARLLVDSVSGLGGEAFDFRRIAPDAVCCTANKCVQGLPGVSFVLVRQGLSTLRRSVYLDLGSALEKQRAGDTPFTPAIQVVAALEAALDELIDETLDGRIARYAGVSKRLRLAIEGLGLGLLLPPELRSNTVTAVRLPEGVSYPRLHDEMREQGYVVYAGQGELAGDTFRVANMGWIPEPRVEGFGPALERSLARARG
jgi:2-aminoethylphosphonate-pyruvate transaminase